MMALVDRPSYLDLMLRYCSVPEIKVLKGVRRCGKSSLLLLLRAQLIAQGVPEHQIFFMSFDEYNTPIAPDAQWLLDIISPHLEGADDEGTFYVLLDEVQEVSGWEIVARRLFARPDTQLFITGSNARILSTDLATQLAGRYIEIEVWPLSFGEHLQFRDAFGWQTASVDEAFWSYVAYGGMPGIFHYEEGDIDGVARLLSGIFDTVILNDVAMHSGISDLDLLDKLIKYTFTTSGNLFSTKKISDSLTSMGRKVAPETIDNYLEALQRALVVMACSQCGLAGKKLLRPVRKWYPVDTGLRNLPNRFATTGDVGFQLENVVYVELCRRGYEVCVGTLPGSEIDFVAKKGDEVCYIQVTQTLLDDAVYERELHPLLAIRDSFPKLILCADRARSGYGEAGVRIMSIADWLLG